MKCEDFNFHYSHGCWLSSMTITNAYAFSFASVMKNSQKFETRVFRFFYVHSGERKKMENFTNVPVERGGMRTVWVEAVRKKKI